MKEFIKIANNGQWTLNKSLHDEKGRCNSCGNKACDGADCKTDHAKAAVETNDKKNKEFANKIKIAGNGQWNLEKGRSNRCDVCNGASDDLRDGMCAECDDTNFTPADKAKASILPAPKVLPGGNKNAGPSTAKLKVVKAE